MFYVKYTKVEVESISESRSLYKKHENVSTTSNFRVMQINGVNSVRLLRPEMNKC